VPGDTSPALHRVTESDGCYFSLFSSSVSLSGTGSLSVVPQYCRRDTLVLHAMTSASAAAVTLWALSQILHIATDRYGESLHGEG
jgi:hypothetical protein